MRLHALSAVHTWQESTPPSVKPAHSIRSVKVYSGSHSWHCLLLRIGTEASCNTSALEPTDQQHRNITDSRLCVLQNHFACVCVSLTVFSRQSPASNKTRSPFFNLSSRIWKTDGLDVIWKIIYTSMGYAFFLMLGRSFLIMHESVHLKVFKINPTKKCSGQNLKEKSV